MSAVLEALDQRLENEGEILNAFLLALSRNQLPDEAWDKLHDAARRDDRITELAFAYEGLAADRKLRTLHASVVAEFMFRSAVFFGDVMGDDVGASTFLDRAMAAMPTHAGSLARYEQKLTGAGQFDKLGDFYFELAQHRARAEQGPVLRKAVDAFEKAGASERLADALTLLVRVEPDDEARARLEDALLRANRPKDVARMLEQTLSTDPAPADDVAFAHRTKLLALYDETNEIERALPHVEWLLERAPGHEGAKSIGDRLLEVRACAPRAAAALAVAAEKREAWSDAIRYYTLELEHARGARRFGPLRALAALRHDREGDLEGAFEMAEQALQIEPSDADLLDRYVVLTRGLGKHEAAQKTLQRIASVSRDPSARARLSAEMGELLLATGDVKRARAAFSSALGVPGATDLALLPALHALARLYVEDEDHASLAEMLERIVKVEPDVVRRQQAAEQLAELASGPLGDPARAVAAYRGLLETPARARALEALEPLLSSLGDAAGLAEVLRARAADAESPDDKRALLVRAAEGLTDAGSDPSAASRAWREIVEQFGPTKDALGRWIPLLELERDFETLGTAYEALVKIERGGAKVETLGRLGLLRLEWLGDPRGAIEALRDALGIDPQHAASRDAMERLLDSKEPALALAAAEVLEPIVRAESSRPGLLRVLLARVAGATDADERGQALSDAVALAEYLPNERGRVLALVRSALEQAIDASRPVAPWLAALDKLAPGEGGAPTRADVLALVLGDRPITSDALLLVAQRLGDAAMLAADRSRALDAYKRALTYSPASPELMASVDLLLREQGTPHDRVKLYRAALANETSSDKRRGLHLAIASLQRKELGDAGGAMETLRAGMAEGPDDATEEALYDLYCETGAFGDACALLEEKLSRTAPGEDERTLRARIARVASDHGLGERAVVHARALAEDAFATSADLDLVEQIAERVEDRGLLAVAAAKRVELAETAEDRVFWFTRLGALHTERGDASAAAAAWREGARVAEEAGDAGAARKLYERVRRGAPFDRVATERLAALVEAAEEWSALPELYASLVESAADAKERRAALLKLADVLERHLDDASGAFDAVARAFLDSPDDPTALARLAELAVVASAAPSFTRTVAAALAGEVGRDHTLRARLVAAKAEVLAKTGANPAEAREVFRAVLDDPHAEDATKTRVADAFETLLERADAREEADAWRWLLGWRAARALGAERAAACARFARFEEQKLEDAARALELWKQAAAADPAGVEAPVEIARLLVATGDAKGALATLRSRLEAGGDDADTTARLRAEVAALLAAIPGRQGEAMAELRASLERRPDDEAALRILVKLLAHPKIGEEASALLEASLASADLAGKKRVLAALVSSATDAPEERRRAWHGQLLEVAESQEEAYSVLLRAIAELPTELAWWDRAEQLARALDRPQELSDLYHGAIAKTLAAEDALELGQRAVSFHEEWFDDAAAVVRILERMVDLDPAGWAFDRLKLLYDSQERWDDLFALYDRILAGDLDERRRADLLEDAAQIAKDFAKNAERAMNYLEQQLEFQPTNPRLLASLERLYERYGKHRELIGLLGAQLGGKEASEAHALRVRMATLWLDELHDAGSALLVVEEMLHAGETGDEVIALLERVLGAAPADEAMKKTLPPTASPLSERVAAAHDSLPPPPQTSSPPRASVPPPGGKGRGKRVLVRQRTASLLRERYADLGREPDLARMLEIELEAVKNAKERIRRHGEVAALHERLGNDLAALEHAVSLVMLDPDATAHRERLARLADKTGRFERLAEVLAAAADDCETDALRATLLEGAATVYDERLGDVGRAVDLLARVLTLDVTPGAMLAAARRLDGLLGRTDRKADRLSVLERLATLEEEAEAKREALGTAARLASDIGQADRSIAAWEARLREDASDLEALDGLVDVLSSSGRPRELATALSKRAEVGTDADANRADRVRAARILSSELDAADEAIEVWESIRKANGEADDVDAALAELYEGRERWKDLAALLARAGARHDDRETRAGLLVRLGDVQRARLGDAQAAIESYEKTLEAAPGQAQAAQGLTALLDDDGAARAALDVLLRDHAAEGAWSATVALLPQRLRLAKDDAERIANLLETAELFESRASDLEAAFHATREAFVLAAGAAEVAAVAGRRADAAYAAGAPDAYRALVDAHRTVLEAIEGQRRPDDPDVLRLRTTLGGLLENRLDDPRGALAQYARVAGDDPTDEAAALSLIRVASRVGRWDAASKIVHDRGALAGAPDETLLRALEDEASAQAGWDALTAAFETGIAQRADLAGEAVRELEARLAAWHRDRRADAEAAEAAFGRALARDPNDTRLLAQLAQLQRRHKGRPLIDSLLRLSQATGGDPDLLREAAEVAARVVVDRGLAKTILERLLKLASERWSSSDEHPPSTVTPGAEEAPPSVGSVTPPTEHVEWALSELIQVHNEEGDADRIVELLETAARLPFPRLRSRELLHQAARTALDRVGDVEAALRLYAGLFEEDPRDEEAATRLADVYASLGRKDDLLALHKKQVSVGSDAASRTPHRLEAALLERELGQVDEAVATLRENLVDAPRHPRTTLVLSETLEGAGRWDELAVFLAEQAALAELAGDSLAAVELWARAGSIAEEKLGALPRALAHYKKSLALEVRASLLDAIARIHEQQKDWLDAASHLDRLVREFPEQRPTVIVRLADAYTNAERDADAQQRLEAALPDLASPPEVASRLAAIYRRTEQWAPLAELIAKQAAATASDDERRTSLVEAAEIFLERCAQPGQAVPLLEQASALAPDDRALKLRLAEALQDAGRADDARGLLRDMIDAFAGRRPKERATVHFYLARLQLRAGERAQALAELEAATRIDPANPEILRMVAELARDDAQLDKAERSYRALLAVLRRADDDAPVLRSEVLVELSVLADRQGEPERAAEILESAFETAAGSDAEAKRLEKALRARGNTQGLLRALHARLERATAPAARADVLVALARAHDELGDPEAALGAQLDAIAATPGAAAVHDAAMALAKKLGERERYVDAVSALADRASEGGDARAACALMLRAADALFALDGGATRAVALLERAKEAGALRAEVLRQLDRAYAALGDDDKRESVLAELSALEVESTSRDPRAVADLLYRLAELRARRASSADDAARSLSTALDLAADAERVVGIAAAAIDRGVASVAMLDVFARAARMTGRAEVVQRAVLLQAAREDAPLPTLREASTVALQSGDAATAEKLLRRVVAAAADQPDVLRHALLELAALVATRDASEALGIELDAGAHSQPEEARRLREGVAVRARQLGDVAMELRARREIALADPRDVSARAGLLELLRTTGDSAALLEVVDLLLPSVEDGAERRTLRLERARILSTEAERADEIVGELRSLLEDEPYDAQAVSLLAELLEARGETGELAELLERQIDAAKDREDGAGVAVLSLRLGSLLEASEPDRARELYVAGLDWEPKNRPLLLAMKRALKTSGADAADVADVTERLLETEQGESAAALALELAGVRAEQWDDAGVERALELGLRGHPASEAIRSRLVALYEERGDRRKLAALKETAARALPAEAAKAELVAAAALHRELDDAVSVARALRAAREIDPGDLGVLESLVQALEARGDEAAAEELAALAASSPEPLVLAALARVRASLGRHDEAIADAERVFAADAAAGTTLLLDVLTRAADAADAEAQKPLRRRAAELYATAGRVDEAHAQLEVLLSLDESDRDTLWAMAGLEESSGRFDTAADTYARLLDLEGEDRLVDTAVRLADAAGRANNPGYARAGLERAHAAAPTDERVLAKLADVYAAIGAHRELAELRLAEARAATDPNRRFDMLVAAGTALLEHDPPGAIAALEEARGVKPTDAECTGLLADALIAAERYDEARDILEAVVASHKGRRSRDLAPIYLRLGRLANALGDPKSALQSFTLALDMDGQNGVVASELAYVALAEGEIDAATRALRVITMLRTPAPISKGIAYERLGEIAMNQGDNRRAVMLLKRAIDEDSTLEHARELLAQLGA